MASTTQKTKLVLGRGRIYLAPVPASGEPADTSEFRYVGNTPEFSINFSEETLDHYSSEAGIKEKDESITLQVDRSGTLTTDQIDPDNLALFLLGTTSVITQVAAAAQQEAMTVSPGQVYQLGRTTSAITGLRDVTFTSITGTGGTPTYVEGTDYISNGRSGTFEVLPGGSIAAATDVEVNFDIDAVTRDRVISGNTPFDGSLMYIEDNPTGENKVWLAPRVRLRASGDFALKSDEFQQLPFAVELLKLGAYEALYSDGEPYTP